MRLIQTLRGFAPAVAVLVAGLLLPVMAGCKDKGAATTPPAQEAAETAELDTPRTPERSNRKGTGEGWRWRGDRDHCLFLVNKECFKSRAEACAAAGCQGDTCVADEALPAQVSCRE